MNFASVNEKDFLEAPTKKQWKRLGLKKRSGVTTPLFSLYSHQSIGVGEFPDLKLFIDWCASVKLGIIQLLPMNDVGYDFRPYDAQSSFALEPMYLALGALKEVDVSAFTESIKKLKDKFPTGALRVDYQVKRAKLELLTEIYQTQSNPSTAYANFVEENQFWLEDYAVYRVLKNMQSQAAWENWQGPFRDKNEDALSEVKKEKASEIEFWKWVQWQCYEQFKEVKEYGIKNDVFMMGDLPFLVSRDSADVWAKQDYFKLNFVVGAPPDRYFAQGQRWGMPPYNWDEIAQHDYDYLIQKLRYAEKFYDLFRIDHVVGVFRIWTMPFKENGGAGSFDPPDEKDWEDHGKRLLSTIVENADMLPCGEDLGTIPACAFSVLREFGIPGMDVQRWMKDWDKTREFKTPDEYRPLSIAMLSTHDMPSFIAWWKYEVASVDEVYVREFFAAQHLNYQELNNEIFDLANSAHGRLRWNKEIKSADELSRRLGVEPEKMKDFISQFEATFDEKQKFCKYLGLSEEKSDGHDLEFIRAAFERIHQSQSIFSVQMLQDWLSLSAEWQEDPWTFRINIPGTDRVENWSIVMPDPIENLMSLKVNQVIKEINENSGRS